MSGVSVTRDTFQMMALVPENLVGLPADAEWAAWLTSTPVDGRTAVVLVSITVTALDPPPGTAKPGAATPGTAKACESLAARARAIHSAGTALIEEFTTPGGNRAVSVRRTVTQRVNGRDVTTGQAQALVVYPGPGALGVVSGVALDPDDLDRAAVLVTEIAAGMTVTSAPAAA
ncbi:MAG: hypothetical protein JWO75_3251 [Actinomycetia bacterium]|nr:hypothetical protein [Actinomycetes bacterium]